MSFFRASGGNKFKIVNGSAKVRVATSKVLYFNGAVNNDWNNLGNWWLDESYTIPATSLPRSIDSVLVDLGLAGSSLNANSGPTPTVYNLTVGDNQENLPRLSFSIDINILNIAIFNNNILVPSNINGNVIFNDSTYGNGGTINGDCTFNDYSYNDGSTVNGDATFNDSSSNNGTVNGDATFNDSSANYYGTISGDATFNNASNNSGTVAGDGTFNGGTVNYATVSSNATFNDTSFNSGTVTGTATFNDSACNDPNVGGAGTFIPNPPPLC